VGPLLARSLKANFVDTDSIIEKREGRTIDDIFRIDGEKRFRELERDVVASLVNKRRRRMVIALGGGAFSNRVVRDSIKQAGLVVYLSCTVREIYRRLSGKTNRPLMNVKPAAGETSREARLRRIHNLLNRRLAHYRQADVTFATTGKTPRQVVSEIRKVLKARYGYY